MEHTLPNMTISEMRKMPNLMNYMYVTVIISVSIWNRLDDQGRRLQRSHYLRCSLVTDPDDLVAGQF